MYVLYVSFLGGVNQPSALQKTPPWVPCICMYARNQKKKIATVKTPLLIPLHEREIVKIKGGERGASFVF